ncbi:MAG: anti-sigma factor [Actinobacteria bacterium]|nr:anti-sigma factor [Actinomycetota bacterium]
MAEMHDLVAAYALDALDPEEERAFEAHLETCPSCQAELALLRAGAADVAGSVATRPPAHLKERVMAATEPEVVPIQLARARRPTGWLLGVAAAAALIVGGVWAATSGGEEDLVAAVLEATDAQTIDLETANGSVRFVYSTSLEAGVFDGERLDSVGSEELYQLWLIGADAVPESAGVFEPGDREVLVEGIETGLALAMTVELAPGVGAPTSDPLFVTEL